MHRATDAPSWWKRKRDDAAAWATGRRWWPRALLLLYLCYAGVRHCADPDYASIFSGITLAIHELGHVLFGFLGEWLGVAGGSITQLAAPAAVALIMLRQRDYFGVAVGGAWLSMSLSNLAVYVADARAEELPLVSLGGGDVVHDWNYLLGSVHLLPHDAAIAGLVRLAALATLAASALLGAWLCAVMARSRAAPA
ncbi:MAG TPA: hypothetical protein VMF70_15645 [Gemmatimonadales bacterium]|nr:hypothetical protein [Gemmatimonadales bacterium]